MTDQNSRVTGKPRVLLVDDETVVCRSISRIIERLGYDVEVAMSGEEALQVASRQRFDAIITDYRMPGMSGPELIERLLSRDAGLKDRFILTGGDLDPAETRPPLQRTAVRALSKPFHLHELGQALRAITGGARTGTPIPA